MLEHLLQNRDCPPDLGIRIYSSYTEPPEFIPYRDLAGDAATAAEFFRGHGVRPGMRVVLPFETLPAAISAFFGLLEIGAVPLSVKPLIFGTSPASYQDFLSRIAEDFRAERIIRTPSLAWTDLPAAELELPPLAAPGASTGLRRPGDEELAFVQFSSGSTGFPRAIPVSYAALRANLAMIARADGRTAGERVSSWLPLYHDMGLVGGLLSCCAEQSDLLLANPMTFLADPAGWWRHMSRERVHGSLIPNFAVDYSLKVLEGLGRQALAELDLSGLRRIYLGSEPINIPNLLGFLDLMAPAGLSRRVFMPCYGLTETVLFVSSRPPDSDLRIADSPSGVPAVSVGAPMPEFSVRLRKDDGTVSAERELGEVELSGGSLAPGYFTDPAPLTGDDGYFRTGDIGFLDDGELFILGRRGDRVEAAGLTCFASDFEQTAERLPFVREGRTAVVSSEGRVVVLAEVDQEARDDIPGSRARIVEEFVRVLGVKVRPEDVHYLKPGQLERTSSGKLRRRAVAEAYAAGRLAGLTLG